MACRGVVQTACRVPGAYAPWKAATTWIRRPNVFPTILSSARKLSSAVPVASSVDSGGVSLPVVDLSCFATDTAADGDAGDAEAVAAARAHVGNQLADACRDLGFFYVVGHELTQARQDAALARAAELFALPLVDKRAIQLPDGYTAAPGFSRGYIGMGEESGSDRLEVKEAFSYGYEWPDDDASQWRNGLQGPNAWPAAGTVPAGWTEDMVGVYDSFMNVTGSITRALSLALGHDEWELSKHCTEGPTISLMRLFHYFPYAAAEGELASAAARAAVASKAERIGSSPHTDWGFLTLILQQPGVVGLQLSHPETGEWVDVPPVEGALLVNIGDYVSLLTAGAFHSPLHRVVTAEKERTSFTLFAYPDYHAAVPMAPVASRTSLFSDQKQGEDGRRGEASEEGLPDSFGAFIQSKWDSVMRQ